MRHVLGISGGKDSSALAIYMRDRVPDMEYFFCDTGAELPETYEYLNRLEAALGKPIARLNADRDFDHWLEVYRGTLPSPQMRWCTKNLKIKPLEAWIGDDQRSPTSRSAPTSTARATSRTKPNITAVFPFIEDGIDHEGVMRILDEAGVGLPAYYEWRTRSGCYFCFFQRKPNGSASQTATRISSSRPSPTRTRSATKRRPCRAASTPGRRASRWTSCWLAEKRSRQGTSRRCARAAA